MIKVEKISRPKVARKRIKIEEGLEVDVEYDGLEVRVLRDGKVMGMARGNFEEVTFEVEEYKISLRKEELEEMLREHQG